IEAKDIRVIAARNVHLLARPVVGGFEQLNKMSNIMDKLPPGITRIIGMDRFAWFYIRSALAERAASVDRVELPEWTDEQIAELIDSRCESAGFNVDFSELRVPSQYLDASEEDALERNRKGVYTMASRLSGGNPSIAMGLFVQCLRQDDKGQIRATLPANLDAREVEQAPINMLLMLRALAQADKITIDLLIDNLRYPRSVIENTLQLAVDRQWVEIEGEQYRLALPWFRSITRVLARQNLLAGVRQELN
ncbi:MAG: hypothetical protein ACR2QG_08035, partial [Gammaproteobacteria bacterium]